MISKKEKITFIAALFFMNVRVDLVGSMSLTELFVLTQIPHLLKWLNEQGRKIPYLNNLTIGFYCLIIVQIIAEFMVHNTFINADQGETTFFKFYLAPILTSLACIITLIKWKWVHKYLFILLFGVSLLIIIGGARTLGFSMLFTTLVLLIYNKYKTIRFKKIMPGLIIGMVFIQFFLTFIYMPKVKRGEWGSNQNRSQFEKINWNSNIFMILFSARSDFFVSTIAFLDKPLWGHGSWAIDKTKKYHILQAKMLDNEYRYDPQINLLIPCHSVVVGKGVSNGVFAFAIFLWIMITIYRIGLKGLSRRSPYNAYLLWTIISSFQLLLFGPPAILKNNSSIAFAVMIALFYFNYLHNLRRIVKKKNMQIPKKQITKTHLYHILSKNEQI